MPAEFAIRNFSVLSYAQGFTQWLYRMGSAPLAEADRPGFFSAAEDMMHLGDMIVITSPEGGMIRFVVQIRPMVIVAKAVL